MRRAETMPSVNNHNQRGRNNHPQPQSTMRKLLLGMTVFAMMGPQQAWPLSKLALPKGCHEPARLIGAYQGKATGLLRCFPASLDAQPGDTQAIPVIRSRHSEEDVSTSHAIGGHPSHMEYKTSNSNRAQ